MNAMTKKTFIVLVLLGLATFVNVGVTISTFTDAYGLQSDIGFCIGFPCLSGGCACYDGCFCFAGCVSCGCQWFETGDGYTVICPFY